MSAEKWTPIPMNRAAYEREVLSRPPDYTAEQRRAVVLWATYHMETERFDRMLPGVMAEGVWLPWDFHGACNEYARSVFKRVEIERRLARISDDDWKWARDYVSDHTRGDVLRSARELIEAFRERDG